ncbi:MAG: hypothetical protein E6I76_05895, partial [Chloroflexi bacterium]
MGLSMTGARAQVRGEAPDAGEEAEPQSRVAASPDQRGARMTTASAATGTTVPAAPPDRVNACRWLLDRRLEAGDGERVAVRCRGRDHTYAEITAAAAAVAAALRTSEVRPEERVLLVMADGPELVAAFCGAM